MAKGRRIFYAEKRVVWGGVGNISLVLRLIVVWSRQRRMLQKAARLAKAHAWPGKGLTRLFSVHTRATPKNLPSFLALKCLLRSLRSKKEKKKSTENFTAFLLQGKMCRKCFFYTWTIKKKESSLLIVGNLLHLILLYYTILYYFLHFNQRF